MKRLSEYEKMKRWEKIFLDVGATYGRALMNRGQTILHLQRKLETVKKQQRRMKVAQELLLEQFYFLDKKFQDLKAIADAQCVRLADLEGDKVALQMLAREELEIRLQFQEINKQMVEESKRYERLLREADTRAREEALGLHPRAAAPGDQGDDRPGEVLHDF